MSGDTLGSTRWIEDPIYGDRTGKYCRCSIGLTTAGSFSQDCQAVFGSEWDYGGDWHTHSCEDLKNDIFSCAGQGTALCKKVRYSSDSDGTIKTQCCTTGSNSNFPKTTCNPTHVNSTSPECHDVMKNYCQQDENFLKDTCRSWLQQAGTDADVIADRLCPKYKDSSNAVGNAFCSCWNIVIPDALKNMPDSDPLKTTLIGAAHCMDPKCNSPESLKPSTQNCDINIAICRNENINAIDNTSQKITVQNVCNAIRHSSGTTNTTNTTDTTDTTDTQAGDDTRKPFYQNPIFWGVIICVLFCLLLLGFLMVSAAQNKARFIEQ